MRRGARRRSSTHLLRTAVAEVFRARLGGADLTGFTSLVAEGGTVFTGELVTGAELLAQVGRIDGLARVLSRLGMPEAPSPGQAASGVELVLEGMHLTRRLAKDVEASSDGNGDRAVYGG